jgi:hypothetical protein
MTLKFAFATALMLTASAANVAPAFAGEDDDVASTRVQRNWNGASTGGQRATTNRPAASGHTTQSAGTSRPAAAASANTGDDDDSGSVRASTRGNRGGNSGRGSGRGYDSQFELDAGEAARIRDAHRDSDRHVTLRRDDGYYDDAPSYYTPPRRQWYSWW